MNAVTHETDRVTLTMARGNWELMIEYLQELNLAKADALAGWIIDELNK